MILAGILTETARIAFHRCAYRSISRCNRFVMTVAYDRDVNDRYVPDCLGPCIIATTFLQRVGRILMDILDRRREHPVAGIGAAISCADVGVVHDGFRAEETITAIFSLAGRERRNQAVTFDCSM